MAAIKKQHLFFPNLDGLRFISFFIVFLSHSFITTNSKIIQSDWYQFIKIRLFSDGDLGVSFFFVLSGFLITYLLLKEKEITGRIDIKSFYIRRALRIWPLYFFCVAFGFIIFPLLKSALGQSPNESANPFLCATFLNNFDRIINGNPDSSVLTILWSIAIEEQFYFLWPILFTLVAEKNYKYIFFIVILCSTIFRIIYYNTIPIELQKSNYGALIIDIHSLGVITDMAIGGLGAYLSLYNNTFLARLKKSPRYFTVITYLLALSFIVFKYQMFSSEILQIGKRIITSIVFIWIILEQNFSENSLFKVGHFKLLSKLGKYTYGLYCLHTIGILVSITLLKKAGYTNYSWQIWCLELPISIGLSLIISWLSFHYFESYFLNLKNKFTYITKGE